VYLRLESVLMFTEPGLDLTYAWVLAAGSSCNVNLQIREGCAVSKIAIRERGGGLEGVLVTDIKMGRWSELASAGCFEAGLLGVVGELGLRESRGGEFLTVSLCNGFDRARLLEISASSVQVDGLRARTALAPCEPWCRTQVAGRVREAVIGFEPEACYLRSNRGKTAGVREGGRWLFRDVRVEVSERFGLEDEQGRPLRGLAVICVGE